MTSTDKKKIAIGLPTAGHTPPEALSSLWLNAFHLGMIQARNPDKYEFYFVPRGRMFTPMNREIILCQAMDFGATHLFMVDDDMTFKQDLLENLLRHNVDIVAPLAFTRNPPYLPVLYQGDLVWNPIEKRESFNFQPIKNYPKNRLVECDAVGFGAVLIDLRIIPKMQPPYFMTSSGTGEDIQFCLAAKKAGARVFMDTSTKIGHLGDALLITEETSQQYNDPDMMEKLYGPYKKYDALEICHQTLKSNDGKELLLAQ